MRKRCLLEVALAPASLADWACWDFSQLLLPVRPDWWDSPSEALGVLTAHAEASADEADLEEDLQEGVQAEERRAVAALRA